MVLTRYLQTIQIKKSESGVSLQGFTQCNRAVVFDFVICQVRIVLSSMTNQFTLFFFSYPPHTSEVERSESCVYLQHLT